MIGSKGATRRYCVMYSSGSKFPLLSNKQLTAHCSLSPRVLSGLIPSLVSVRVIVFVILCGSFLLRDDVKVLLGVCACADCELINAVSVSLLCV